MMKAHELKHYRQHLGLSVRALAEAVGWTASSGREIRRMEADTKDIPADIAGRIYKLVDVKEGRG